jgi:hypothetical protein
MESSVRSGGETSGKKSRWLWWFASGVILGVLGTLFLPDLLRPYLPDMLKGENVEIAGVVEAKSREADRLLLTIGGDAGAVLVTYTQEIPEMDLLIEPGDSVVLAVREYAPFVEDPSVRRVQKGTAIERRQPAREQADPSPAEIQRRSVPTRTDTTPSASLDAEFQRDIGPTGDSLEAPRDGGEAEGVEMPPPAEADGAQDPEN